MSEELPALSRRALVVDAWDDARFATVMSDLDVMAVEGEALLTVAPDTGADLWADMFAVFDQASPRLVDAVDLDGDCRANYAVISSLIGLPELVQLREWTMGDAYASALACCALRSTVEILYDRFRTTERMRRAAEEKVSDQDQDQDQAVVAQEEADAGERTLLLRSAMAKAAVEAEQAQNQATMLLPDAGEVKRMPAARRMALAQRLTTRRFRRMADVFGAMETLLASARRNRVPGAPTDTGDIEYGRDLTRVLPSALLMMDDPDWGDVFMEDYAAGHLPMLERRGEAEAARGGIICCCDSSISMAEPSHAPNEEKAKAMALALLHQCRRQRRPFYGIVFADRWREGPLKGQRQLIEFDFSAAYTAETVLDFAEVFIGGYTNFTYPLDRSVEILEAEFAAQGRTDGDIVFVTDGEDRLDDEWAAGWTARMAAVDARLWGLLCEDASREPLESLCLATGGAVATYDQITDPGVDLRAVLTGLVR